MILLLHLVEATCSVFFKSDTSLHDEGSPKYTILLIRVAYKNIFTFRRKEVRDKPNNVWKFWRKILDLLVLAQPQTYYTTASCIFSLPQTISSLTHVHQSFLALSICNFLTMYHRTPCFFESSATGFPLKSVHQENCFVTASN